MTDQNKQKSSAPEPLAGHQPPGLPLFIMSFAALVCGVICCCAMEYSTDRQQTFRTLTSLQQTPKLSPFAPGSAAPEFSPVHRHYGTSVNLPQKADTAGDTPSGFLPYTRAAVLPPDEESPVVLYFHASWSGNCQRMGNTLKNSGDVQQWKSRLRILHVDSGKYPDLCKKYAVTDFPTLLFLSADGTAVRPLVGNRPVAQVLTFFENNAGQQEIAATEMTPSEPEQITEPEPATAEAEVAPSKPRVRLHQLHRKQNSR